MSEAKSSPQERDNYKGWLYKWTNYIKGYQKRWFVLHNSMLSYYRSQAEMAHTCRGTINLLSASIHTADSTTFIISSSGTQSFYLKASSEIERQKWVTALELAKDRAIHLTESDSDEEVTKRLDKNELGTAVKTLTAKLEDLNTCNDLIAKHGAALLKALSASDRDNPLDTKTINERATLFRITATAMINACADYLDLAQSQGHRWQKMLQSEHDQKIKLEEMIEQIAKQQAAFENKVRRANREQPEYASSDDENEFMDAVETQIDEFVVSLPGAPCHKRSGSEVSSGAFEPDRVCESWTDSDDESDVNSKEARVLYSKVEELRKAEKLSHRSSLNASRDSINSLKSGVERCQDSDASAVVTGKRVRRCRIPERPNYSINMWSILKNCIGKELSKIAMPVNFNEPLSLLQRLTEELEYSECLNLAARCDDSTEQMVHVAAYTISAYSTTTNRSFKPFNPLLGETYECDHTDDGGWRYISEQVSHHPPIASSYVEGPGWVLSQEFAMTSKFRGKYLQIIPLGQTHLRFTKTGAHYTWRKVTTTVHNIIVGRFWVDNHGEMDIVNHTTGEKCHLKYSAYSYFSKETPRKVTGVVTNSEGIAEWVLTGTWDSNMEAAFVRNIIDTPKGKPVFETGPHKTVWKRRYPPPESEKMYNMTQLAIQLNEMEEGVAPTDSRHRPDQRFMEDGQWNDANKTKLLLEDKQRARRRRREVEAEAASAQGLEYPEYQPVWFKKEMDPITGSVIHTYMHEYWECKEKGDWSRCPDIFL